MIYSKKIERVNMSYKKTGKISKEKAREGWLDPIWVTS